MRPAGEGDPGYGEARRFQHRAPARGAGGGGRDPLKAGLSALALLPLAAAAAEWTAALPALAPALRACLAGDAAAFAFAAEPLPGDLVAVRVQRGAAVEDCLARTSGEVVRRQARPDLPVAEAMAPAFFLDRRCVDARRVDGPDGRVLGWLAYPAC